MVGAVYFHHKWRFGRYVVYFAFFVINEYEKLTLYHAEKNRKIGLATLLEKKHRRIELALYVLQRALDGVHKIASQKFGEKVASPVFGDSLLFASLLSVILHSHLRHSDLIRPAYRSFLSRFFDTDERHVFI